MTSTTIAIGLGFGLVINVVWLLFWSGVCSRFLFRADQPLLRALKCTVAAVAITWVLNIAIVMWAPFGPIGIQLDWIAILVDILAPVLVFLWEWRSFERHWIDDDIELVE